MGGGHDFRLYNVPFIAQKPVYFNVSRSAAPKLALLPASCYNCDVKQSNFNVCAKLNYDCKRFGSEPMTSTLSRCIFFLKN